MQKIDSMNVPKYSLEIYSLSIEDNYRSSIILKYICKW